MWPVRALLEAVTPLLAATITTVSRVLYLKVGPVGARGGTLGISSSRARLNLKGLWPRL